MAFVYESPASEWVKNRYDWTSVPLLYTGEAGSFCRVPDSATVDRERDVIFFLGGGGMGRTSDEFQPYTYILFFQNTPIKCQILDGIMPATVEKPKYKIWKLLRVNLPQSLESRKNEIYETFMEISKVATSVRDQGKDIEFDSSEVKWEIENA